jgi:hypothetical protein
VGRLADRRGYLGSGAETPVEEPPLAQLVQRRGIGRQPPGLKDHGAIPDQAQPGEILQDGFGEGWPAAGGVDVFHAQQEAPAGGAGGVMGEKGGKGVPSVKQAGG